MALLGDDGRGYELARKLESHGVWRTWLGDSLYSNFIHFLSSPSSWEAFMRADFVDVSAAGAGSDSSRSRAQLQLQLRARALLFDKASVSLYLRSNTHSISKLNPNYLQLHGDDVYFTLEEAAQPRDIAGDGATGVSSKVQSKSSFGVGSRYNEPNALSQRFKFDELPETWYAQFFEAYRTSKSYRLSSGDQDNEKRTPEQMFTYLRVAEKHKRKRAAFREDQNTGVSNSTLQNGANMLSTSLLNNDHNSDEDILFFPETMFSMNCVPDGAIMLKSGVQSCEKLEFNGVLDNLPQVVTKSAIMIERLGIRPEYLSSDRGGKQYHGKNGLEVSRKLLSHGQASMLSQKVIAHSLSKLGFEGSSKVPLDVLSQLLSCHICKLGRTLKLFSDSYRRHCSATELLKMFLHTTGYSNLGVLSELVKNATRSAVPQNQQHPQGVQSQLQGPIRQTQQIPREMLPKIQQMLHSQNLALQHQQWERIRKQRQESAPRPGMVMDKDRPLVQVKVEAPSDFPVDNTTFNPMNSRHPQMQQFRQQQLAAMSLHAQNSNQFRPMTSLPIPQMPSPNMGLVRAPPVKVEGFHDLIGGDTSLKHDLEENKLTSPPK